MLEITKPCKVTSIGNIRIKIFDGVERILMEVRHVPPLMRNLISLGILDIEGSIYKCEGGFKGHKRFFGYHEGIEAKWVVYHDG